MGIFVFFFLIFKTTLNLFLKILYSAINFVDNTFRSIKLLKRFSEKIMGPIFQKFICVLYTIFYRKLKFESKLCHGPIDLVYSTFHLNMILVRKVVRHDFFVVFLDGKYLIFFWSDQKEIPQFFSMIVIWHYFLFPLKKTIPNRPPPPGKKTQNRHNLSNKHHSEVLAHPPPFKKQSSPPPKDPFGKGGLKF